jgi:hypothetical protein
MSEATRWRRFACGAVFAASFAGCHAGDGGRSDQAPGEVSQDVETPDPLEQPPEPVADVPRLTRERLARVVEGMSYSAVVGIIGDPAEELASNRVGSFRMVVYRWRPEAGFGAADLTFENGVLFSKAASGL